MNNKKALIIFLVIVFCFAGIFTGIRLVSKIPMHFQSAKVTEFGVSKVALVNMNGAIYSSKYYIDLLERYREDYTVKAIVLRIDSPGGGVGACQEIYDELMKIRNDKENPKKIVVSFGAVSASGGYYIGCAGDWIFASPGTLTGSIGVIMESMNFEELMKKIGIQSDVVKSGKFKDIGSSYKKMTTEERAILQDVIDDVYMQFVDAVAEGRKNAIAKKLGGDKGAKDVTMEEIKKEIMRSADGRIFSGKQALKLGFVDQMGTLDDAVMEAGRLCNIKGKPEIVTPRKKGTFMDYLIGDNDVSEQLHGFFHKGFSYIYGK